MSFDHEVNLVKAELGPYRFGAEQAVQAEQQTPPALLDALEVACRGLPITPAEVQAALAPEDLTAWEHGDLPPDTLHAFVQALSWQREMDQGKAPTHYTARALCASCGPVWLFTEGTVASCPWCRKREAGRHTPAPVVCRECCHWHPDKINPPGGLGSCAFQAPASKRTGVYWPRGKIICAAWCPQAGQP